MEWDGRSLLSGGIQRAALPFPIPGMSDRMPYPSTKYREMGQEMHRCWKEAFRRVVDQAVHEFQPDIILSTTSGCCPPTSGVAPWDSDDRHLTEPIFGNWSYPQGSPKRS